MRTDVPRRVIAVARENGIALLSAGLAFYMFNVLVPMFVFFLIGITTVQWGEGVVQLVGPVLGLDPDSALSTAEELIGDGTGRRNAAVIAAAILIWSAFTMFQSINMAFDHVYGTRGRRSALHTILETGLVVASVGVGMVLLLSVHLGLTALVGPAWATVASIPLLAIGLVGAFVPMFYQFSPSKVSAREVLPGAVFAAVAWTVCAVGFRVYLVMSEGIELYGVAGGVMLLLTWIYVAALALLVGVVVNAVLADRIDADDRWKPAS